MHRDELAPRHSTAALAAIVCIQWLLPLPEPSRLKPGAPRVDAATAKAFRHDDSLRLTRILKCLLWLRLQDEARHFLRALAGPCVKEPGAGVHSMSQAFWPQSLRGVPEWSRDPGAPG